MRSRLARFAARYGWRAVVVFGLLPVLPAAFLTVLYAHGALRIMAVGSYDAAAAVIILLAWQIAFRSEHA